MPTAFFVFFSTPLSMRRILNRPTSFYMTFFSSILVKGGFFELLYKTKPPKVETKLSIPDGVPC